MQIGEYIASNGGVVTAEELAPYLDLETTYQMVFLFLMIYSLVVVLLLLFCNACLCSFLARNNNSWGSYCQIDYHLWKNNY